MKKLIDEKTEQIIKDLISLGVMEAEVILKVTKDELEKIRNEQEFFIIESEQNKKTKEAIGADEVYKIRNFKFFIKTLSE